VREGRRQEFAAFGWQDSVPDPQDEETFNRSRLNHSLKDQEPHQTLLRFYRRLICLRDELALATADSHTARELGDRQLLLTYHADSRDLAVVFNFAEFPVALDLPELAGGWTTLLNSADLSWKGPDQKSNPTEYRLSPYSFRLLENRPALREAH
jgi:maltooligosyltrehalose trehalohydrolase